PARLVSRLPRPVQLHPVRRLPANHDRYNPRHSRSSDPRRHQPGPRIRLSRVLDSTSKVSAILGTFVGHFQIPNSKDASPVFTVNGIDTFDSAKAKETQLEQNYYAVL